MTPYLRQPSLTGAWAQWWLIAAAGIVVIVIAVALGRLVLNADADRRARLRDACAALVQHVLLFGFAVAAAAISAHGLIGFARASMGGSSSCSPSCPRCCPRNRRR